MRKGTDNGKYSVHAIAGIYVITLSFDAKPEYVDTLLGFAIHRTEYDNGKIHEEYWLKGYKPFGDMVKNPKPGMKYSTYEHPIQSFMWGDFTVKPGTTYEYKVVPVSGKPKKLEYGSELKVKVTTEPLSDSLHEIHFNRAVAASQAYADKFDNMKPNDKRLSKAEKEERKKWLSRGLFEAICNFISQAKDSNWGIRAAIYELDYPGVLSVFRKAAERADVKIIYEAREGLTQTKQNVEALIAAGFQSNDRKITFARKNTVGIPHNKFIVLLYKNKPVMVWTGSTNLSEGGIFGHANVGHCIKDYELAGEYLKYWNLLRDDPDKTSLANKISKLWPDKTILNDLANGKMVAVFSPRKGFKMLDAYADTFSNAGKMANITFPFNLDKRFIEKIEKQSEALRFIILNSGKKNLTLAEHLNPDPDVVIAPGSKIDKEWHQWLNEIHSGLNGANVLYIHTKFLLKDPLGPGPVVITGSANFSEPSTNKNDENMVLIPCSNESGKTRIQDIYLGEFFRLFDHIYFRYLHSLNQSTDEDDKKHCFLRSDPKEWVTGYYTKGTDKFKRREIFKYGFH